MAQFGPESLVHRWVSPSSTLSFRPDPTRTSELVRLARASLPERPPRLNGGFPTNVVNTPMTSHPSVVVLGGRMRAWTGIEVRGFPRPRGRRRVVHRRDRLARDDPRGGEGGPESHGGIITQADRDHGGDAGPRAGPGRGLRPARARGHRLRSGRRGDRGAPRGPGAPHVFEAVDVAREDRVKAWARRILAAYGAPDLLINNAALINRNAPTWDVPAEEFDRLIDVNIKGVANVLRHVVPAMIAGGSGVIVNLSSYWGRSVSPEVAPYCASKWAIEGLTRALAQELPEGPGRRPPQPGHHRHRDAPQHLRRESRPLPESVGVGRVRRPVPAGARAGGQRQAAHRAGAVSRHLATEFPG